MNQVAFTPASVLPPGRAARPSVRRAASLLLLGLLAAAAPPASGFVLPGPFVLARCRERVARLAGLQVVLEVQQGADVQLETLSIDAHGGLRFTPATPRVGAESLQALLGGQAAELARSLGVDAGRTSLARLDGRVVVVVGALAGEADRPQLWVDQETFFPVRLLAGGRDLVLHELASTLTAGRFPRTIQVRERGSLLWQAQVVRLGPAA